MEPIFIFFSIITIYCGYLTFKDLMGIREKVTKNAITELRVIERAGRIKLVLIRDKTLSGSFYSWLLRSNFQSRTT